MLLVADGSNYSGKLSTDHVRRMREAGVGLFIPQSINPPPTRPPGVTQQQIETCLAEGMPVGPYFWQYHPHDGDDFNGRLRLVEPYHGQLAMAALDVEDNRGSVMGSTTRDQREAEALASAQTLDNLVPGWLGYPTWIYSAPWYWGDGAAYGEGYLGNSWAFKDRPLWVCSSGPRPSSEADFPWFGGWAEAVAIQYELDTSVGGLGGVDISLASPELERRLIAGPGQVAPLDPLPDPVDEYPEIDYGWIAKKADVVNAAGYIEGDLVGDLRTQAANLQALADRFEQAARSILGK